MKPPETGDIRSSLMSSCAANSWHQPLAVLQAWSPASQGLRQPLAQSLMSSSVTASCLPRAGVTRCA